MFSLKNSRKSVSAAILALLFAAQTSYAAPIVTDGNTATTLSTSGSVTDITTATVQGNTAFNSFKQFDVKSGKTVNLHLPGGTDNLLNLVHKRKTKIDGILNGYQNGQIGGNVFFLNPNGVAIGSNGVVNVGSLTVITPTKEFMKDFFTAPGNPSASATAQVLSGDVPLRGFAGISVAGKINAERTVSLLAGDVTVAGQINAGVAAQSSIAGFGNFVNIDGVEVGADLVVDNGAVKIVAVDDVKITGQINVDGKDGVAGGDIDIDAGDAITVNKDAVVSAKGVGNNSDGGEIIILAQDDATLDDNAVVDVSAGLSGDGGFVEFSAIDEVNLDGGSLLAIAENGLPGTVLIDPAVVTLLDIFLGGGSLVVIADIIDVVGTISTRQIAGVDHLNDLSTGDSGDVTILGKQINVEPGAQILTFANNGFMGGNINLEVTSIFTGEPDPVEVAINVENANLWGENISLRAIASVQNIGFTADEVVTNVHAEINIGAGSILNAEQTLSLSADAVGNTSILETEIADESNIEQNVSAHVNVEGGALLSSEDGDIALSSQAINSIFAHLSNVDNIVYDDITALFSTATTEATSTIAAGAAVLTPNSLTVFSNATTSIDIDLLHQKPDAISPSAAMAVSEVASNAESTIATGLIPPNVVIGSNSVITSNVQAATAFPVSLTALEGGADLEDLPFTMTLAMSQHNNRAKGGFIDGAIANIDTLVVALEATDVSNLAVDPGASEENTSIKGIIDGEFLSVAELCLDELEVTVNNLLDVDIVVDAPESIDGLSEISKKEVTSELGVDPMFTKIWRLQSSSASRRDSSYEFTEDFSFMEDSDSTSDMDSDSGMMMDSGGDSGEGFSFEYMTESSFDTSSESSSDSSSSSTSSSTSESTSTSESSSDSDSSFESDSSSTSSSSSSEDE